jgi:predicted TIM-barrel fold metal-dependent hydrolase
MDLFSKYRVIDVDTHVTEPPDVWTSRVPSRWRERVPHIERIDGKDRWVIDGKAGPGPGIFSIAGFDGRPPDEYPATYSDFLPATYDAKARIEHMDREGIYAQVLYPNVGGFGSQNFLRMNEPELMLACVRAYNDFLSEWASVAPERLLPVTALPFWDVAASVAEIERCSERGHRSILFPSQPQDFRQPTLADAHWDPVWSVAQERSLAISFHIGGQATLGVREGNPFQDRAGIGLKAQFARISALAFIGNALGISEIICGGVCHRFPGVNFVSVESGASWVPGLIEALDWQWHNAGVAREHPEYELLPSEYFRRQVYACFWFERDMLTRAIEVYPDNVLYETDFPHPTSMSPGPATPALHPRVYAAEALGALPEPLIRKVLHDNAARVYHVN